MNLSFARAGYAALHIDYRGYVFSAPVSENHRLWGYTDFSQDAVNATLALRAANLDYLDMDRVGLFGHSMGGRGTLDAALGRPDLFKVGVVWGPVSTNNW